MQITSLDDVPLDDSMLCQIAKRIDSSRGFRARRRMVVERVKIIVAMLRIGFALKRNCGITLYDIRQVTKGNLDLVLKKILENLGDYDSKEAQSIVTRTLNYLQTELTQEELDVVIREEVIN